MTQGEILRQKFKSDVQKFLNKDYTILEPEFRSDAKKGDVVKGQSESSLKRELYDLGWKELSRDFGTKLNLAGFAVSYGKNDRGNKGYVVHIQTKGEQK